MSLCLVLYGMCVLMHSKIDCIFAVKENYKCIDVLLCRVAVLRHVVFRCVVLLIAVLTLLR
jgi:hypothetical protein